jgi:putative acyl-CoA dehydrogenase
VLTEALMREGGEWGLDEVTELGALSGSRQAQRWGELADRNQPILRTHDRYGNRIDEVEYDPAYHELMKVAVGHGLHAATTPTWRRYTSLCSPAGNTTPS